MVMQICVVVDFDFSQFARSAKFKMLSASWFSISSSLTLRRSARRVGSTSCRECVAEHLVGLAYPARPRGWCALAPASLHVRLDDGLGRGVHLSLVEAGLRDVVGSVAK